MITTAARSALLADDVQRVAGELSRASAVMDELRLRVHSAGQLRWESPAAAAFREVLAHQERQMQAAAGMLLDSAAMLARYAAQLRAVALEASLCHVSPDPFAGTGGPGLLR
ncbi:hypothetical protein [Arthrobacter sp. H14-L1]|uniref:hypothetical protein n=1 Tax=Arthrobacter sp. H14-L1 TaxID=2996697 RepID=UPI00226D761D|nr:hypothetical protein [Arthrobacter sp. H14-L1]MCY0905053.1 hypothetical protein [Arthrobacter sp. H14-L1]